MMTVPAMQNVVLNESEIERRQTLLNSKPRMLMIVLTTNCNLDCIMCTRLKAETAITLPKKAVEKIIPLFPGLEAIDWQGGEVFTVNYFKELFTEAIKHKHIKHSIITNGLLIDRQWAEMFALSNTSITFSIDSVKKETYEAIRRKGDFNELLSKLKIINEAKKSANSGTILHLNAVIMRSNYKEVLLFPDFCAENGISHLRFDFLRPEAAPHEDILINRTDAEAAEYLRGVLPEVKARCEKNNIWFDSTLAPLLEVKKQDDGSRSEVSGDVQVQKRQNIFCKLPWKKLFIDAARNGDVFPDCLCDIKIGNILTDSIEDIWNGSRMREYRAKMRDGKIEQFCSKICKSNAVDRFHFEGKC
jgi:MoaA/NifB/PqqE/SkfB family radical SAM enzyme